MINYWLINHPSASSYCTIPRAQHPLAEKQTTVKQVPESNSVLDAIALWPEFTYWAGFCLGAASPAAGATVVTSSPVIGLV